jgi:formylglycine-generating enzyme required for sulfatase activity
MINLPETVIIPAGKYGIGDALLRESVPVHEVTLAAFALMRGTVTNAQFAVFIADGGYAKAALWSDYGWRWRSSKSITQPAFWDVPQFNQPMQPIVGISWYEALAFAMWFMQLTGIAWRLPSEAEWEAAARPDLNTFLLPEKTSINSAEQGLGNAWDAVGQGNQAACGAFNLLGNVWEWCSTRWGRNWQTLEYPYPWQADEREDLTGSHARVMRGGSWFDPITAAQPAFRARYLPGSRGSNIGFRLVHAL